MNKLITIAKNTFVETLRQPVYAVIVATALLLFVVSPSLSMYTMDDDNKFLRELGLSPGTVTFYRGEGCQACKHSGYQGRVGIFELMDMSETIRGQIVAKASSSVIKSSALQAGFKSLRQDGLIKAASGVTSVEEVLRVTQETEGV